MTPDELNLIIFRYLVDSGFSNTAHAFENEAGIRRSTIDSNMIPLGALVTFVPKDVDVSQSGLDREHAQERKKEHEHENASEREHVQERESEREREKQCERDQAQPREKEHDRERVKEKQQMEKERELENGRERGTGKDRETPHADLSDARHDGDKIKIEPEEDIARFSNTAHAFGNEAGIRRSTIDSNMIPPGALVTFVPKDVDVSQSGLDREHAQERKKEHEHENASEREHVQERESEREREKQCERDQAQPREKEHDRERVKEKQQMEKERELENGRERGTGKDRETPHADLSDARHDGDKIKIEPEEDIAKPEPLEVEAVNISSNTTAMICIIPDTDVTVLKGHSQEPVVACAWSPSGPLLASGAGDSTARIWIINKGLCNVLRHFEGRRPSWDCFVQILDWNSEGTLLATGCCNTVDTRIRIWTTDGELVNTLDKHKGELFSLKWNKKGDYLLSGSADKTAIVWDTNTGECKQQFEFHSAPLLDADWRNNLSFATCSVDKMIYVCKVGEDRPVKTFSGHQGEVEAVKWDPTGQLLASCSADATVKIWSMKQNTCVHDLKGHTAKVFSIRWCPAGPGTNISSPQLLLASASFDSTIKLWDGQSGSLIYSLDDHREPVYSVAFSPNGDYLASGSSDNRMIVWSMKEARIVKTYTGNGVIFQVCWNKEGDRIAAGLATGEVCVFDLRM